MRPQQVATTTSEPAHRTQFTQPLASTGPATPLDLSHTDAASVDSHQSNFARAAAIALTLALAAWLIGTTARLIGLALSLRRLRAIVRNSWPAPAEQFGELGSSISRRVQLRRPLILRESDEVHAPIAAGIIADCVLLPTGLAARLSAESLRAVLCHEAAHLKRRDHLAVLLQELLAAALWWHPLVHRFNRELTRAREEVCDNHALRAVDSISYSQTLLRIAHGVLPIDRLIGATSMADPHWKLEQRISSILDERRQVMTGASWRSVAMIAAAAVAVTAGMAATRVSGQEAGAAANPAAAADPAPGESTRVLTQSFPIVEGEHLRFANLAGRVDVVKGDGDAVVIEATLHAAGDDADQTRQLLESMDWVLYTDPDAGDNAKPVWTLRYPIGDATVIRYRPEENVNYFGRERYMGQIVTLTSDPAAAGPMLYADLVVKMPDRSAVSLANSVGDIRAQGVSGDLTLSSDSGDTSAAGVSGHLTLNSDSGDVRIRAVNGQVTARADSGDIQINLAGVKGNLALHTDNGEVNITGPADAAFHIVHVAENGQTNVGYDDTHTASVSRGGRDSKQTVITRGQGGPNITIHTDNGDLNVNPEDDARP